MVYYWVLHRPTPNGRVVLAKIHFVNVRPKTVFILFTVVLISFCFFTAATIGNIVISLVFQSKRVVIILPRFCYFMFWSQRTSQARFLLKSHLPAQCFRCCLYRHSSGVHSLRDRKSTRLNSSHVK